MKRLVTIIVSSVVGMAALLGDTVSTGTYPVTPHLRHMASRNQPPTLRTGVPGTDPSILREITSSITPLSDFGISPGFPFLLNAVRIEAVDMFATNRVTAVATNVVPEPSTAMLLLGAGFVGLLCHGWQRTKQIRFHLGHQIGSTGGIRGGGLLR